MIRLHRNVTIVLALPFVVIPWLPPDTVTVNVPGITPPLSVPAKSNFQLMCSTGAVCVNVRLLAVPFKVPFQFILPVALLQFDGVALT